ncbi:hypothetical protein JZ751_001550 [Albula glossodonta]|uniref:Uncharacterized protein n=1 Tax=Albula glossodonta TaxID=121402 RepID=A0A8T2PTT2_9TELE|nr:hypothetical protein JZ751_001550 [Albula glossodonta]
MESRSMREGGKPKHLIKQQDDRRLMCEMMLEEVLFSVLGYKGEERSWLHRLLSDCTASGRELIGLPGLTAVFGLTSLQWLTSFDINLREMRMLNALSYE